MVELLEDRPAPEVEEALEEVERAMHRHLQAGELGDESYAEIVGLVEAALQLPQAAMSAGGIAGLHLSAALVYGRPVEEVEPILRAMLMGPAPLRVAWQRVAKLCAACSEHPQLAPYKQAEAAALRSEPPSQLRDELLRALSE